MKIWEIFTSITSFWMPSFILRSFGMSAEQISYWREKILILTLFIISSSCVALLIDVIPNLICPQGYIPTTELNNLPNVVIINGMVVSIPLLKDSNKIKIAKEFVGRDISTNFPTFSLLAKSQQTQNFYDSEIAKCISNPNMTDNWLTEKLRDTRYTIENERLVGCPLPNNSSGKCFINPNDFFELRDASLGYRGISKSQIIPSQYSRDNFGPSYVTLSGFVLDVGDYLRYATVSLNEKAQFSQENAFLPSALNDIFINGIGMDITSSLSNIQGNIKKSILKNCLLKLFLVGVIENPIYNECLNLYGPINVLYFIISIVILVKLIFSAFETKTLFKNFDRHQALLVIHPGESNGNLKKCFDSVLKANSECDIKIALLFFDLESLDIFSKKNPCLEALNALEYSGKDTKGVEYSLYGNQRKSNGRAKIFYGTYHSDCKNVIPYIVIAKEHNPYSNTGRIDNYLILLDFLRKSQGASTALFSPFEYVLYSAFVELKASPEDIVYMLTLESDMRINNNSVQKMEQYMKNPNISVVYGNSKHSGSIFSIPGLLQRPYYFFLNHLEPSFEGPFHVSCFIPSTFAMFKLKNENGSLALLSSKYLDALSSRMDSLFSKNAQVLGKERYLSSIIFNISSQASTKYDSSIIAEKPVSSCIYTMLLSSLKHLVATFSLSMHLFRFSNSKRSVLFLQLVRMLFSPIIIVCLYVFLGRTILLIAITDWKYAFSINHTQIHSYSLVLVIYILLWVLVMLIHAVKKDFGLVISSILFSVIGIPIFFVILPFLSFIGMDYFINHPKVEQDLKKSQYYVPVKNLSEWDSDHHTNKIPSLGRSESFEKAFQTLGNSDDVNKHLLVDITNTSSSVMDVKITKNYSFDERQRFDSFMTAESASSVDIQYDRDASSTYSDEEFPGKLKRANSLLRSEYISHYEQLDLPSRNSVMTATTRTSRSSHTSHY